MLKTVKLTALSLAAFWLSAAPAQAQQAIELKGDVALEQTVTGDDGTQTVVRVAPETIVPGDRLVFSTSYVNGSSEAVTDFVVTNPLPAAVRLAPDADATLVVSVDGGENWGSLSTLQVVDAEGSPRAASHDDVTHIRWTLAEVPAGARGSVEYPAIIR